MKRKNIFLVYFLTIFLLLTYFYALHSGFVFGQTVEPTKKDEADNAKSGDKKESDTESKKIEELTEKEKEKIKYIKEKVASKVEELSDDSYGTAGFVSKVLDESLLVETESGQVEVMIEEGITKIFDISGKKPKEIDIEDISENNYISASGPKIDAVTNANTVYIDTHHVVMSGKITEVNSNDFYIKIITPEKDSFTVDIEKGTQQEIVDMESFQLKEIGFSKIKVGDTVHFVAQRGPQDDQVRFSARKILIIPQEYFQR